MVNSEILTTHHSPLTTHHSPLIIYFFGGAGGLPIGGAVMSVGGATIPVGAGGRSGSSDVGTNPVGVCTGCGTGGGGMSTDFNGGLLTSGVMPGNTSGGGTTLADGVPVLISTTCGVARLRISANTSGIFCATRRSNISLDSS
jgi:hypothetical protein